MISAGGANEKNSPHSPRSSMARAGGRASGPVLGFIGSGTQHGTGIEAILTFDANKGDRLVVAVAISDGGAGDLFNAVYNGVGLVLDKFNVFGSSGQLSVFLLSLTIAPNNVVAGNLVVDFGASYDYVILASRLTNIPTPQLSGTSDFASVASVTAIASGNVNFAGAPQTHYGVIATNGPPTDTLGTWQNGMSAARRDGFTGADSFSLKDAWKTVNPASVASASITGQTSRHSYALVAIYA